MQFKYKYTVLWSKTFLFQTIQYSQTVLIQTIQFTICMQFSSIQPTDRAPSGATIQGQSGPGSNGNEEVFCIPIRLFSIINRTLGAGGGSYPSPEVQLV